MKHKISLSALSLLGALSFGTALAADQPPPAEDRPPGKSAGEYIDDAAITAKVKTAFVKDKEVKALHVKVKTVNGVVQLSGTAGSRNEIERAEQLAGKVPGVKSVTNEIRLKEAADKP